MLQAPAEMIDANTNDISLGLVWQIIQKRKILILLILAVGVLAGVYLAIQPKQFSATGRLEIRPGASRRFDITQLQSGSSDSDEKLGTDVQVLESRTLALAVAQKLGLQNRPEFYQGLPGRHPYSLDTPEGRDVVAYHFAALLGVDRLAKTDVIVISINSQSQQLSADIVNSVMNEYIDNLFKTRYASTARAANWLTTQIDDLKNQVQSDQSKLVELQKRLGLVGVDQSKNLDVTELEGLTSAATQASIERIVAEARYRILQETSPDLIEGGPTMLAPLNGPQQGASLLATLRASQADLTSQLAQLRTQFGSNYTEVKQVQAKLNATNKAIQAEEQRILNEAKVNYNASLNNETLTTKRLDSKRANAFAQHNDLVAFNLLQQDYISHRALYQGLLQRLREAGITSGLESSEVDVIDFADVPVRPSGKGPYLKFFICLIIGAILALIVAGLLEILDNSVHDAAVVESSTGLALYGIMPRIDGKDLQQNRSQSGAARVEIQTHPNSQFSEAARTLRTSFLLSAPTRRQRVVVVTSTAPGEGKSTISSNLAAALALAGQRVLLIDADLRRPQQANIWSVSNKIGLSNYLSGGLGWREEVVPVGDVEGLFLLPSGVRPPLPAELLASAAMATLIEESILSGLVDASLLGQLAGATIFVVRSGRVQKRQLIRAVQQAHRSGGNPKGFVLNDVTRGSRDYYDYYSYGAYGSDAKKENGL
jgi:succinoglycan biosynthesis transport protein ExoP